METPSDDTLKSPGTNVISRILRGVAKRGSFEEQANKLVAEESQGTIVTELSEEEDSLLEEGSLLEDFSVDGDDSSRRIRFATDSDVMPLLSRRNLGCTDEQRACWWHNGDYAACAIDAVQLVRSTEELGQSLHDHHGDDDQADSIRGLESHGTMGSVAKAQNRKLSIRVVLKIQKQQRKRGAPNPTVMAHLYGDACSGSQMWAYRTGLSDQRVALECYMDTLDGDCGTSL